MSSASPIEASAAKYRTLFDEDNQQNLRKEYENLNAEKREQIDLIIEHMMDMNNDETMVFTHTVQSRKTHPLKIGEISVDWPAFKRKDDPEAKDDWERMQLTGYPKQIITDAITGKLFEGMELAQADTSTEAEEPVEAEQEAFDIVLLGFEAKGKLKVIKEIKGLLGLGLAESKDMVEGTTKEPVVIFKKVGKDHEADKIAKLIEVGAQIEIR